MTKDKIFLLGAGASYGSGSQGTPPLGSGLFDALRRFNPDGWGAVPNELATRFREDFEQAILSVDGSHLGPLQRAMAAYFFEFRPQPSSLYLQLAGRIAQTLWSGALCTLNYDRLLELSLSQYNVQPFGGIAPDHGKCVELCYPHGCCHIFCDGARGRARSVSFQAHAVQIDGPVVAISDPVTHRKRIEEDAFPPVMSYFEPGKYTTSGSTFIKGQRARWSQLTAAAEAIAIVGVRVRPHDEHIWSPVARSPAQVIYCSGPAGATEYEAWAGKYRIGRHDIVLEGHFREEFGNLCSQMGL